MVTAADCQACGACCGPIHDEEGYVGLDQRDLGRLSKRYRRLHVIQPFGPESFELATKRDPTNGVVCVALHGKIGRHVRCGIYERRPAACRAFRPGGRECLAARGALRIGR